MVVKSAESLADAAIEAAAEAVDRTVSATRHRHPDEAALWAAVARDLMVGASALRAPLSLGHVFTAGGGRYSP